MQTQPSCCNADRPGSDPKFRVTRAQRSWPCALCATTGRGCCSGVCSQPSLRPSAASTFPPRLALSTPKVLTGSGRPSLGYRDVDTRSTITAYPQAYGSLQEERSAVPHLYVSRDMLCGQATATRSAGWRRSKSDT